MALIEHPWRIWLFSLSLRLDVSHGDPLAGLTQSPCFPLKSHSAVVLLGAMQVNISISIESVLFWRSTVFLGSSALIQLRLGSSSDPSPSTAPLHMPHNGEHKQNLSPSPSSFSPVWTCHRIRTGKTKTKEQFIIVWRSSLWERVRVFASLHMLQANKQDTGKHKPTGKPAIKVKLCGKDTPDVYSLAQS